MNHIGVGLIGTGFMGKCHALAWAGVKPVYGDVPTPRLVSLCEVTADLARERAAAFGFAHATTDWRALVNDPAVDVVSITTPNHLHAEMAIAALKAGKHVWCEKPMATTLVDADSMAAAAKASGRIALLGYNYIQNPLVRQIRKLLEADAIGPVNHVRIEMDEDFMADAGAPFTWRSEKAAGFGALDDFGVHPLSLISTLFGPVEQVFGDMFAPYPERPLGKPGARKVETYDVATALLRLAGGINATLLLSRTAWGRKGRILMQIFGSRGSIVYDQERMNEVRLFTADGPPETRGFRAILSAPVHAPYGLFIPAPGHQLGFNDLKIIECRQLLGKIAGEAAAVGIDFAEGLRIERTVHAIALSAREGRWVKLAE